jgi:hypothetical protein
LIALTSARPCHLEPINDDQIGKAVGVQARSRSCLGQGNFASNELSGTAHRKHGDGDATDVCGRDPGDGETDDDLS